MKNLAIFSVKRAITVFMAVIIVAVFGVVSFTRLTTDLFPSMNIPYSVVVTTYIGASPTEVEEVLSKPLEETLSTTTSVKDVQSTSQENVSIIMLEFQGDTNMDSAIIEMREQLDMAMANMPDGVGEPMIIKINPDMMPIMVFSISDDDMNQKELTKYVESDILPQIERVGGVASVSLNGAYEQEVQIVLNETAISALNAMIPVEAGISIDKQLITDILNAQNFEFPVGYADIDGVTYLVRVGDEFDSVEEIGNLLLVNTDLGMGPVQVKLSDLATIEYVNSNTEEYSKVNGDDSITVVVQKSSSFATTDVTNELNEVLNSFDEEGLSFTILLDQGEYINQSTGGVVTNLLIGAGLAIAILLVFLKDLRATFIVGIAIPISLLFAIVLIYLSGITLNIVSLGGLALGIGMLVDNSIVVMENIFRLKKQGLSNKEAAIQGTAQVGGAITASTLTTISVFLPVIFIEGFIKEIFMQMAMTIAFSLTASLLIALTLVPSVSSKILKEYTVVKENESKFMDKVKDAYEKVFHFAFKFKFVVLPLVLILFVASIYAATYRGFEYFPESDEGQLNLTVMNPTIDPLSYTDFATKLDEIGIDVLEFNDVETVGVSLGAGNSMFLGIQDSDSASFNIILDADRELSTKEVQALIDEKLTNDYPMIEFDISGSQGMTTAMTGSGIQVELKGHDLDELKAEAIKITDILETVDGLKDIDNGVGKEADELKITVDKDEAIKYNVMTVMVLGAVAEELKTEEVATTLTVEGSIYDVYVYDSSSNYSGTTYTKEDIEQIELPGVKTIIVEGVPTQVPLVVGDVADVEFIKGFSTITRHNGTRTLTISAEFEEGFNGSLVAQDVETALEDYTAPEGYVYEILGENEEIMEAMEVLVLAVALGVVLIYMIMASQFQSLTYPFIIMFTIPLAFTGGFLILWISGLTLSVVALIGLIILTGVVVNNGIVLVDYTNQLREEGYSVTDALVEAGRTRLRPIVMTALTTILALTTMALGFGEGAEMMQPMAVTTIGGLIYATLLTLIVVPIMYYLVTKQGRMIVLLSVAVVALLGGIAAFRFTDYWWALPLGALLSVVLSALAYFTRRVVTNE